MHEVCEDYLQIRLYPVIFRVKTPLFICGVGYKFHHNQIPIFVLARDDHGNYDSVRHEAMLKLSGLALSAEAASY